MTRKILFRLLSAAVVAASLLAPCSALEPSRGAAGAAIAEEAPAAATASATPVAPRLPTPEEIAARIERRYSGISSYKATFTVWRPDHGKKMDEEKLKEHWDFEKKRIEKYTLWHRDGASDSTAAAGTAEGAADGLDDYIRLRGVKGPLKGTEVFYDPSIKEPRATVVHGAKAMKLNSGDQRLMDIVKADARIFASDTAAKLRDPALKKKIQRENEGGNIIITTKAIPLYKNDVSRTKTTRWTVTLAPDGSLKKLIHEEKFVAPPGMMDALKSGLKSLVGIRHTPPKPKFNIMHIYTWGGLAEAPPLPEDHFIYKKPKEGERGGR